MAMRNTRQVTNQSSHGELSFHHNPHLRHCWGLHLPTSRVTRRRGARLKHAAHFTYCHCCELCALKQKPGVLLEKSIGVTTETTHKSLMQTVLITASGPQALNALVHRTRYTQGSRQNRCVSLREALALRANASGPGWACRRIRRPHSSYLDSLLVHSAAQRASTCTSPSSRSGATPGVGRPEALFFQQKSKLPSQNCLRRGIQLYN